MRSLLRSRWLAPLALALPRSLTSPLALALPLTLVTGCGRSQACHDAQKEAARQWDALYAAENRALVASTTAALSAGVAHRAGDPGAAPPSENPIDGDAVRALAAIKVAADEATHDPAAAWRAAQAVPETERTHAARTAADAARAACLPAQ